MDLIAQLVRPGLELSVPRRAYRGTSLIRNSTPPRTNIGLL